MIAFPPGSYSAYPTLPPSAKGVPAGHTLGRPSREGQESSGKPFQNDPQRPIEHSGNTGEQPVSPVIEVIGEAPRHVNQALSAYRAVSQSAARVSARIEVVGFYREV